jgi:putative transposase
MAPGAAARRALGTRAPIVLPQKPNQRWSLDFLSDALNDGRQFRILAVVDGFSRECLCLVGDPSLSGRWVARELDAVIVRRGRPAICVSDNGTELTSMAVLHWSQETGVGWHYIVPGKPIRNAFVESFNGRLRDELPNETLFNLARSCPCGPGGLAGRLQHRPAAQRDRQPAADDLCHAQRPRDATRRHAARARGFAPRPVAPPSQTGSNDERTLSITG